MELERGIPREHVVAQYDSKLQIITNTACLVLLFLGHSCLEGLACEGNVLNHQLVARLLPW
jgi:hypothetical protein